MARVEEGLQDLLLDLHSYFYACFLYPHCLQSACVQRCGFNLLIFHLFSYDHVSRKLK
jgi:hypothetical protein